MTSNDLVTRDEGEEASSAAVALATITLPIVRAPRMRRSPSARRLPSWRQDPWFLGLMLVAFCASVASIWSAYATHTILLYGDAHSHLLIARRIFDAARPGLAQLGNVWLPLPHLIMIPLAWNDFLWRSGLAGSLSSMVCYLIAVCYVYFTAQRLIWNNSAAFIGTLVFALNPNILYLQSTPLSEPALFATLAASSYYLIAWAQDERLLDLALTALSLFLSTISRYDGWALYLAVLACVALITWSKRKGYGDQVAYLSTVGTLGGVGIFLWFIWNWIIFGSPTDFLNGPFSSSQQTKSFIAKGYAATYHNLWMSLWTYSAASAESIGPAIFALGVAAVVAFFAARRISPEALAALTLLVPFAFYVVAFYTGQDVMYVPHANTPPYFFYNARFGAEMAAPAAVFIATLTDWVATRLPLGNILLMLAIGAQLVTTSWGGVISLQDGQYGLSCYPGHPVVAYLAEHYNGGKVLVDLYHTQIDFSSSGIPFRNEIYEGDQSLWNQALIAPAQYADWVIVLKGDMVSQHINIHSSSFLQQYVLVAQDNVQGATAVQLFHRRGLPPLPNRPLPGDVITPYLACDAAKGIAP
ncbi:MAG TPA: glycosyltransferase family 39 protein [Ktedonobacterales bacterium]|jgi:hypothetical protein|nr:glycosyltransferase family 39 protein [Ktedonobacterales bacterium]